MEMTEPLAGTATPPRAHLTLADDERQDFQEALKIIGFDRRFPGAALSLLCHEVLLRCRCHCACGDHDNEADKDCDICRTWPTVALYFTPVTPRVTRENPR
jgi:hypothetical protein